MKYDDSQTGPGDFGTGGSPEFSFASGKMSFKMTKDPDETFEDVAVEVKNSDGDIIETWGLSDLDDESNGDDLEFTHDVSGFSSDDYDFSGTFTLMRSRSPEGDSFGISLP